MILKKQFLKKLTKLKIYFFKDPHIYLMKSEFYNFRNNENCLLFEFQSVSDLRVIEKVIVYSPFGEDSSIYNLALGDILENG